MKKWWFLVNCLLVFFLLVACGNEVDTKVTHCGVEAKSVYFEKLDEMEDYSDLIIKGERLEEQEAVITTVNGYIASGYTFSKVKITEIYEDKSGEYRVGDEITILENEVYDEANDIVYHIGGYNMMIVGDEYLLFLHHAQTNGVDYYVASGVNCGTISLNSDERQTVYTTREGNQVVDFSVYQDIWDDAKDKYIY